MPLLLPFLSRSTSLSCKILVPFRNHLHRTFSPFVETEAPSAYRLACLLFQDSPYQQPPSVKKSFCPQPIQCDRRTLATPRGPLGRNALSVGKGTPFRRRIPTAAHKATSLVPNLRTAEQRDFMTLPTPSTKDLPEAKNRNDL